ncbi:MAG: hypothetical protein REI11_21140, partial [Patulibacter sp.]|nr:hypothetical protein [Patulibacter sp.]
APWSSGTGLPELDLARDGRAVYYSGSAPFPTGTYRYDLSSGAVTKVSDAQMENDQIDDAGRVIGTSRGLLVDGRTLPYPAPIPVTLTDTNFLTVKTSPDGSAALLLYGTRVFLMNTATGTSRELSYPSSLGQASWIVGVANGGGSYTVADNVRRADGTMVLFAERVDTATGAVTQIGGDIPSNTIGDAITAMTPDGSFAASATTLGALGTLPIPGTQHPIPQINPTKYVKFYPGCSYGSWLAPAVKAYFLTPGLEVGVIDHQTPASVLVTVYEGSPLKLTNQFTVKPSAGNVNHGLVTPTNGGFSYRAAVTFTDGTTRTGFGTIPPYTPMKNDRTIWDAGICSNGLGGGPLT